MAILYALVMSLGRFVFRWHLEASHPGSMLLRTSNFMQHMKRSVSHRPQACVTPWNVGITLSI